MMIPRKISAELQVQLGEYPIVTVLGPRQAGKTTLVRKSLANYEYVNLETPDVREFATSDPRGFLKRYSREVIFDEIQRAPDLISYLQGIVDERPGNGQFVLTGSHQLALRAAISQSLAGRTSILHLLPFSIGELADYGITHSGFEQYIHTGFLPRIYDQGQRPATAYANYFRTYVERDVRQLINLKDANLFDRFIRLLAGRVGNLLNYASIANDVGVDAKTIKEWISVLEASFIVFQLPPFFKNFGKRVIKSPKIYFVEPGLVAYLLGIEKPEQVGRDPLVGALFENLVVVEVMKTRYNLGYSSDMHFYRDSNGSEIDLLVGSGRNLVGLEIKSAATFDRRFVRQLKSFSKNNLELSKSLVVYNGEDMELSDGHQIIHFSEVNDHI